MAEAAHLGTPTPDELPTLGETKSSSLVRPRGGTAHRRKGTSEIAQSYIEAVKEDTKYCGDCSAKSVQWASSIRHAGKIEGIVLVCNRCAGVHRSMGVHVCEVRSLNLDTWSDDLAEMLHEQGDPNLNHEFEYHVPPEYKKPNEDSLTGVLDTYIRAKYEDRLFHWDNNADEEPLPPQLDMEGGHAETLDDIHAVAQQEFHGVLNIFLKSAAFLPTADLFSESDPYVIMKHGLNQQCKSKVIRNCNNPVWDEQLSISVNEDLPIEIEIYDWDVRNDDLIGIIRNWNWRKDIPPDKSTSITMNVDCSVYKKKRKKQATITMDIYYTKLA